MSPALFCAEFGTSMKNMYEFDSLFGAVAVEAAGQTMVSAAATRNSSMKRRLICYLLCSPVPPRSFRIVGRRATLTLAPSPGAPYSSLIAWQGAGRRGPAA